MINIEGLNKAEILAELYNNSKPLGLGILHYKKEDMTIEEAERLLKSTKFFDYLQGRVMKIRLDSNTHFDGFLYNRDNGEGAAERVVENIRKKQMHKTTD